MTSLALEVPAAVPAATRQLGDEQIEILERVIGIRALPESQGEVARSRGQDQGSVSRLQTSALETLEKGRLAGQWLPVEPESARRTLVAVLPEFGGDPVQLAVRICQDVHLMEGGELFIGHVEPRESFGLVLERERLPADLEQLERRVRETFGEWACCPTAAPCAMY